MTTAGLTARPAWQGAGRDLQGRICRESYHAVLSGGAARTLRIGAITRRRGEALCGAAPVEDCPPGLFPPIVTCHACQAIARREHVEIEEDGS
jgi:hypothetical protein